MAIVADVINEPVTCIRVNKYESRVIQVDNDNGDNSQKGGKEEERKETCEQIEVQQSRKNSPMKLQHILQKHILKLTIPEMQFQIRVLLL